MNSRLMPCPVSLTVISTVDPGDASFTTTRPPLPVNFTAFDNKFQITCWSLFASPDTIARVVHEQPEHPSEAVDMLIEAGQYEGILEESDRDLIHSVVEFGDKVVREVMTPRPNIVAVPSTTTIEELTTILNEHPYSRLPVFEGNIDHVIGIVFVRDLLRTCADVL